MASGNEQNKALVKVYAEGFLSAVEDQGCLEDAVAAFDDLVDYLKKDQTFANFLMSSAIDIHQRRVTLETLFRSRLNDALLNLLQVMNIRRRLTLILQVHRRVMLRMEERKGQQEVTVQTPTPLSDTLRSLIKHKVSAWLGKEAVIIEEIRPEIIGGLILQTGDLRIDGSLAAWFQRLRKQMKSRIGHAIHDGKGFEEAAA
ncbi:MAG: F0F1 ATP synthase subunit delta [Phycisphaerales bacterium]|nr:F0F1 ATP synthase subunit delta [Phycisphaerales bacterium]